MQIASGRQRATNGAQRTINVLVLPFQCYQKTVVFEGESGGLTCTLNLRKIFHWATPEASIRSGNQSSSRTMWVMRECEFLALRGNANLQFHVDFITLTAPFNILRSLILPVIAV